MTHIIVCTYMGVCMYYFSTTVVRHYDTGKFYKGMAP